MVERCQDGSQKRAQTRFSIARLHLLLVPRALCDKIDEEHRSCTAVVDPEGALCNKIMVHAHSCQRHVVLSHLCQLDIFILIYLLDCKSKHIVVLAPI